MSVLFAQYPKPLTSNFANNKHRTNNTTHSKTPTRGSTVAPIMETVAVFAVLLAGDPLHWRHCDGARSPKQKHHCTELSSHNLRPQEPHQARPFQQLHRRRVSDVALQLLQPTVSRPFTELLCRPNTQQHRSLQNTNVSQPRRE